MIESQILKAVWGKLDKQQFVYVVLQASAMYVMDASEEEYSYIRVFLTKMECDQYIQELIEREDYRPSELSAGNISLDDLYELIPEFEVMSQELYGCSSKIVLTSVHDGSIICEDLLHDPTAILN